MTIPPQLQVGDQFRANGRSEPLRVAQIIETFARGPDNVQYLVVAEDRTRWFVLRLQTESESTWGGLMGPTPHSLETILNEVTRALNAHLFYAAIAIAFMLPDICAALESDNGETSPHKYQKWYDRWLALKYPDVSSGAFYALRNGMVHQGRLSHRSLQLGTQPLPFARIVFAVDEGAKYQHNNLLGDTLQLSVSTFCRDMLEAVLAWNAVMHDDKNVQRHLPHLVKLREDGLSPYVATVTILG